MSAPSWYPYHQAIAKTYHTNKGLDKILECDLYQLVFIINLTQINVIWEEETSMEEVPVSNGLVIMSVV